MSAATAQQRSECWRHRGVVLLAVNSGATDAIGFIGLGGAFTSVMTGNLVLAGVGAATRDSQLALLTSTAIVAYCLGCSIGALIAGFPREHDPVWPRAITWALGAQLVATLAWATGWWVTSADPDATTALALLLVNALGLGIQSSAVQRFGVSGLSTTYLTGTLTTVVVSLTHRRPVTTVRRSAELLLSLVAGAAVGATVIELAPMAAPAVQLTCLAVVLLIALVRQRAPGRPTPTPTRTEDTDLSVARHTPSR